MKTKAADDDDQVRRDQVQRKLASIIADILCIDVAELGPDTDIALDLGVESIEFVNIVAVVEERMGVALDVSQLLDIRWFYQVVDLVAAKTYEVSG